MNEVRLERKLEVYEIYLQDNGYEAVLITDDTTLGLHVLKVDFGADYKERARLMTMIFIPVDSDSGMKVDLLQCYTEIERIVEKENQTDLLKILNSINNKGTMGLFALNAEGKIFCKMVLVEYKQNVQEEEQILNAVQLIEFGLNLYTPLLDEFLNGNYSAEEVINAL